MSAFRQLLSAVALGLPTLSFATPTVDVLPVREVERPEGVPSSWWKAHTTLGGGPDGLQAHVGARFGFPSVWVEGSTFASPGDAARWGGEGSVGFRPVWTRTPSVSLALIARAGALPLDGGAYGGGGVLSSFQWGGLRVRMGAQAVGWKSTWGVVLQGSGAFQTGPLVWSGGVHGVLRPTAAARPASLGWASGTIQWTRGVATEVRGTVGGGEGCLRWGEWIGACGSGVAARVVISGKLWGAARAPRSPPPATP